MSGCLGLFSFFSRWKTKAGRSSGLFCQTMGTFLRIQGQGGGQRVYCGVGGLTGVTQRNVPAHGSRTATLFRRQYNPHVCTQGMLGTDFWHLVFVKSITGRKDLRANVVTGGRNNCLITDGQLLNVSKLLKCWQFTGRFRCVLLKSPLTDSEATCPWFPV